jgi:hypothetical protein
MPISLPQRGPQRRQTYEQEFENGRIVAIPFSMDINDPPHAMPCHAIRPDAAPVVEMADDFLAHALKNDDGAIVMAVTARPHCLDAQAE